MKKSLLLLPIVLLFVVGCGKFSGLKGKRVMFSSKNSSGREFLMGEDEFYFLVKTSENTVTLRICDDRWDECHDERRDKNRIVWMEKHEKQLKMPKLDEKVQSWLRRNGL